jgi:integrase
MASIKILLRNKPNKEGQYPIVLKIIKDRKVKVITLGISCLEKDWDKVNVKFKKSQNNYMQRNRALLKKKEEALKIIDDFMLEGIDFTLNQFEAKFRGKASNTITVFEFWLEKISDFNKAGRIGSARAHKDTRDSFFKFIENKTILFRDINHSVLDKYEVYLRSNNNTDGGIAFKMRELRALFNDAIKKEVTKEEYYPFKTYKISKLKGRNIKKALTREEMRALENIDTNKYPHLLDTKNYMIFSYYTGGMNFIDLLKLTWENVDDERINYSRSKTKSNFSVQILEPVKKILEYYKKQNRSTNVVFPILLKEGLTPQQIENRKHKTLRKFNKQLKEIATIQGVNKNISSYHIRHSFATNLKFAGVSSDVISDAMGHKSVEITNSYLKRHSNETLDNEMKKLLEEPMLQYVS